MPMIQVRNVPPEVHNRLKAKAALEGMTLSDYLLRELTHLSGQRTWDEIFASINSRPDFGITTEEIVETIREMRGPIFLDDDE